MYTVGGQTTPANCQVLQTRVNREKKDLFVHGKDELKAMGYEKLNFTHEEMDLVEMSVFGDVRRSTEGPVPGYFSSMIKCECKSVSNERMDSPDLFIPRCREGSAG